MVSQQDWLYVINNTAITKMYFVAKRPGIKKHNNYLF